MKNSLKHVSAGIDIELPECSGSKGLSDAKGEIFGLIHPDFKIFPANNKKAEKVFVSVCELTKDLTTQQLYGDEFKKFYLAQEQIEKFIKKYPNWIQPRGFLTLFLFESNGEPVIAKAFKTRGGKIDLWSHEFRCDNKWYSFLGPWVVFPRLLL